MTEPSQVQVHPLAALSEATFDVEVARNRRLILSQQVYELSQMVTQKDERIKDLEAQLGIHTASDTFCTTVGDNAAETLPESEGE